MPSLANKIRKYTRSPISVETELERLAEMSFPNGSNKKSRQKKSASSKNKPTIFQKLTDYIFMRRIGDTRTRRSSSRRSRRSRRITRRTRQN